MIIQFYCTAKSYLVFRLRFCSFFKYLWNDKWVNVLYGVYLKFQNRLTALLKNRHKRAKNFKRLGTLIYCSDFNCFFIFLCSCSGEKHLNQKHKKVFIWMAPPYSRLWQKENVSDSISNQLIHIQKNMLSFSFPFPNSFIFFLSYEFF